MGSARRGSNPLAVALWFSCRARPSAVLAGALLAACFPAGAAVLPVFGNYRLVGVRICCLSLRFFLRASVFDSCFVPGSVYAFVVVSVLGYLPSACLLVSRSGHSRCGAIACIRVFLRVQSPRSGIEPGSSARRAELLTTFLPRVCACVRGRAVCSLSATELIARATTCTLRGYRVGTAAGTAGALDPGACGLRLALLSCAGGWLALRTPAVAVDRARVVFLNILAFGLCVLVAHWIRHRPTEPGIAGSSPAGVISKA